MKVTGLIKALIFLELQGLCYTIIDSTLAGFSGHIGQQVQARGHMATLPDDFFTVATFGTLAGSVGITVVVTGALHKARGWAPAKTGLFAAFLVVIAGLLLADKIGDWKADVVGFFNAFLVYLSAAGISDAASSKTRGVAPGSRPFFRPWFR